MVATHDYIWEQGEDLIIEILYKINDEPVDLTGHSVRMDIAPRQSNLNMAPVFSFNSDDIEDPFNPELHPDSEATLNPDGKIHIAVPRSLTLPGGVVGDALSRHTEYGYDLFLRTPNDTQKKLLQGRIHVRKSVTQWL